MARLGFSYKDILAFYYPGTEIRGKYGEEVIPVPIETTPKNGECCLYFKGDMYNNQPGVIKMAYQAKV